jgi:hypothetical protein
MLEDSLSSGPAYPKVDAKDLSEVGEGDLVLYSPTVLGLSLNDKIWCKDVLITSVLINAGV